MPTNQSNTNTDQSNEKLAAFTDALMIAITRSSDMDDYIDGCDKEPTFEQEGKVAKFTAAQELPPYRHVPMGRMEYTVTITAKYIPFDDDDAEPEGSESGDYWPRR